ncbi:MAG: ElyC/SanA/YdcF family protein [Candidatus Udaeobacter sp.]
MREVTIERLSSRPPTITNAPALTRDRRLFGLATRRERWALSWKGWLVIALVVIGMARLLIHAAYPFLAVTHRVNADTLVVEGWVHPYAIRAAVNEFQAGHYERAFTTGGPVAGMGGYTNDYNTSAIQAAAQLQAEGISADLIQAVPARISERDRTYSAARALSAWLSEHHSRVHAINVLTQDVHARRTRLLFERALGEHTAVGIIAVPNPDYDAKHWWRYSEGVRDVISEAIAYLYARFVFAGTSAK